MIRFFFESLEDDAQMKFLKDWLKTKPDKQGHLDMFLAHLHLMMHPARLETV